MILTYLKLGAAVLLIGGAFVGGYKTADNSWKASMLEAEQAHTKAMLRELEKSNAAAADLEKARAQRKVVYRTITKEVERIVAQPAYAQQCFTDDGVRAANSAILGEATPPGQPAGGVPAPKPLVGRTGRNGS